MIANLFGPDLGYVVIIVLVVVVGGSQLPKIARNIGTAGKEFRKAQHEAEQEEAQREQAAQAQPDVHPAAVAPAPPATAVPPAMSVAGPAGSETQPSMRPSDAFNARDDQMRRNATG